MVSLQKESEWEKEWTKLSGFNDMINIGKVKSLKKFMRKAIATEVSNREKEIAEEVEKINNKANIGEYLKAKEHAKEYETALNIGAYEVTKEILSILKHQ